MTLNDLLTRPDAQYATEGELSAALGRSLSALRTWAARRQGPPRTRLGKQIFYPIGGLRRWLEENTTDFDAARAESGRHPRRRRVA